ncbi:hypothetical protein C2R22_06015 [Salinigranum rubrum]|uniref:Uncharacterized protein n=1 Tax=Salinigranum rubrum TaxID=755307 RepID=A0A2I8VHA7_9EURY|nr:hypothetical protein [Salinigranum rubrum]AUV81274.1 hypothetical protein C2R22_06015 [Salinigranum rubrum]
MTRSDLDPQAVIDALELGDGIALEIWRALDEPGCAQDFIDEGMPQATVYRALDELHTACLIEETDSKLRPDTRRRCQYYIRPNDALTLRVVDDGSLVLTTHLRVDREIRREVDYYHDRR